MEKTEPVANEALAKAEKEETSIEKTSVEKTSFDEDESVDSFRKCVDQIQPLPENMQTKHYARSGKSGGGEGKRVRYGRGRGRGGRSSY
ncbi:hypothetical protein BC332_01799 [Capsicum chinense]|nr:hypothetical protein BC332_01799 [Capsicum chinense]